MEDNLFDDLLASAEEMVAIESGNVQATVTREYQRPDSKSLHLKQAEFAAALGVSGSSWTVASKFMSQKSAPVILARLIKAL